MTEIVTFLTENWDGIVAVLVAVHGLALAIVNLTPTPADDEVLGKIYKVIEALAGISNTAKEYPGERDHG